MLPHIPAGITSPPAPRAIPGQSKEAGEEWGDVVSVLEWASTENSILVDKYISEARLTKQEKCFTETNLLPLNSPWEWKSQHQLFTLIFSTFTSSNL